MTTSKMKVERVKHGLTQSELADRAGVGLSTIVALENGKRIASGRIMVAVAKALESTVADLFFADNI